MSNGYYRVVVNTDSISRAFGEITQEMQLALTQGIQLASAMAFAHANELARDRLKSRLSMFLDGLSYQKITDGVWSIELDESKSWIDDGLQPRDMKPDLLRKNAKTAKDGSRYKVIPFSHDKRPQDQTDKQKELVDSIKRELKVRKIPFKKIELKSDGSPRLGKLHTLNIDSARPTSKSSHPALQGVNIYQRLGPKGAIRRDIVTFRVVSSKQTDKWFHPGLRPVSIMDDTYTWVVNEFENKILPDILASFDKKGV
jgi:hypothetical protein